MLLPSPIHIIAFFQGETTMTDQAGYHGLEVVDKLTEMLIELDANALAFTDANVHAIHTVFEQLHPVDRDETVFQQQVGDNPNEQCDPWC